MPTIRQKDIAQRLGLSKAYVSMALRNDPRVPFAMREKVQRTAAEMGYQPDPALHRLAQRRWAGHQAVPNVALAFLAGSRDDYRFQRANITAAIESQLPEYGYTMEVQFASDYDNTGRLADILQARGVAGVFVFASQIRHVWSGFPWERFSMVQVLSGAELPLPCCTIRPDTFSALVDAGERILRTAPERAAIYLIEQDYDSLSDLRNRAAALLVLDRWRNAGIQTNLEIFEGEERVEQLHEHLLKAAESSLIIPNSGLLSEALCERLAENRTRIIAHHHNSEVSLAGYRFSDEMLARRALLLLDSLVRKGIRGFPFTPDHTVVMGTWQSGPGFE